jgi:hypothetical protein
MKTHLAIALFLLTMLMTRSPANAQASLAAENIIDDVKVVTSVGTEMFTLFRDARDEKQWYYVPNRPLLVEVAGENGQQMPQFSLLRYQFADPADASKLVEEGILQFASSMAAPAEALAQFKKSIQERSGLSDVRISAIPFKAAEVALYTYPGADGKSKLISAAPYGSGVAPLFSSQSMAFSIPLTRMGSDVFDKLSTGNTGIPVAVTFTFNALTPPSGFKITVDYDQLYSHYSKDEKMRASASYFGWFSASYEKTVQQIRESLINNKSISVEVISGENFKLEDIDKYLQPVLARINAELIESAKPPETVVPAQASSPSRGGWYGGGGYSVALKDITKVKKGKEVWDMRIQSIVERKTVAQGFIGIGKYSDAIKNQAIVVVPDSKFKSAYLMLPSPSVAEELGITNIDLEVDLKAGGTSQSQVVQWRPGSQWKDIAQKERTTLAFPLTAAAQADPTLSHAVFNTKVKITTNRQFLQLNSRSDAFNGQKSMLGINGALFEVVEISGDQLPFKDLGSGEVLQANVALTAGGQKYNAVLKPRSVNGKFSSPEPLRILVPKNLMKNPISAVITIQTSAGPRKWKYNGKEFGDESSFGGLSVFLQDNDFVK